MLAGERHELPGAHHRAHRSRERARGGSRGTAHALAVRPWSASRPARAGCCAPTGLRGRRRRRRTRPSSGASRRRSRGR
ncbi:hypothetical protein ACFPRL_08755 [Pseudoclavibacter helvolus]